jgi:hypothetical protein
VVRLLLLLALLLTIAVPLISQGTDQNSANGSEPAGYGAFVSRMGTINTTTGVFMGGKGCWIIDHVFGVGGSGYVLVNSVNSTSPDTLGRSRMAMEYGGLQLEYTPSGIHGVFVTAEVMIGLGGISFDQQQYTNPRQLHDSFFIIEPALSIDVPLVEFARIGVGAGYRIVQGLSSTISTDAKLSGPSWILTLKLGAF